MAEEIKNDNETMETDYVAAIEELKRNTVSREQFDKMKNENKRLLDALANNQQLEGAAAIKVEKKSINDLANSIMSGNNSNLNYIKNALELRERMLEEGMEDPFVPQGKKISPTREDYELAQRVADGLQSCIDYADGDSAIFTQELQRITKDTAIPRRRR